MIPLRQLEAAVKLGVEAVEGASASMTRSALADEAFATSRLLRSDVNTVAPKIGVRVGNELKALDTDQFFDKFDVTYAATPLYANPLVGVGTRPEVVGRLPLESLRSAFIEKLTRKLGHATQNHFPNPLLNWLYGEEIRAGRVADVAIGRSKAGNGLFAVSDLRPGQFVGEYTGVAEESVSRHWNNPYTFQFRSGGVMNAENYGNEMRFINHSERNANLQPVHIDVDGHEHIALIVNKPIHAGNELLYNYGKNYWTHLKPIELGE
jgi:SET domain